MDLKGIADLKNAFNQIQSDLLFFRQKSTEENNGMCNEINIMISFIRQNENSLENSSFINEIQISDGPSFSSVAELETIWKCYKDTIQQIFPVLIGINGTSSQDNNKSQSYGVEYEALPNSYIQSKIYLPLPQTINANNWSQMNSDMTMISPTQNHFNFSDQAKNTFRNNIYSANKIHSGINEILSMHGGGDSVTLRRTKLAHQPEKDIEEIQQTISMQLKLQQHHSKNRFKFQPTHRAWPITPEINVVFQNNNSTNQFPLQNSFSPNSETQIYTPSTIVGLHTPYPSQQPHVSHLINHSISSNNAFYGFNNTYTGQLTSAAIIQPNDADFAQLPSSMFGFLNNSTSNRIANCNLNTVSSLNNAMSLNIENFDSADITNGQNSNYTMHNNIGIKSYETQSLSKLCEPKPNLINYQMKASTLTWEDLANVISTSSN